MKRTKTVVAVALTGAFALAACSSSKTASTTAAPTTAAAATTTAAAATTTAAAATTTAAGATTTAGGAASTTAAPTTGAPTTTAAPTAWAVDTTKCSDPAAATKPITGSVTVGSIMPLTGGPAVAFAPVAEGFKTFIDYANAKNLVPGYKLNLQIADDQYNKDLTPGAAEKLITEQKVDMFAGIIGTPDNAAVEDTLNEECYPQLMALSGSPAWGDVAKHPWTTGGLVPYSIEAKVYAAKIKELFPNGAKVAIFAVNNEFGQVYVDAFKKIAAEGGITIVDEQQINAEDSNPPTSQLTSISSKKPDAIMAVPLGLQCPTFLKELKNSEAQTSGWTPAVFLTNTCASKLFLSTLAGDAGTGVYTSSNGKDSNDPKFASDPGVKAFLDAYKAAGLKNDPATTSVGWSAGETVVTILNAAIKSGTLSRASIIDAARNLTFTPSLARDGIQYKMDGAKDAYANESLQVLQWDNTKGVFTEIGAPVTQFEGTTANG